MLFYLSFWIKGKSVATLDIRTNAIETQNTKSVLPPYPRIGDSTGEISKSGVTLGLNHLYLLSLRDLHFVLCIGFALILHPDLGHLFR